MGTPEWQPFPIGDGSRAAACRKAARYALIVAHHVRETTAVIREQAEQGHRRFHGCMLKSRLSLRRSRHCI